MLSFKSCCNYINSIKYFRHLGCIDIMFVNEDSSDLATSDPFGDPFDQPLTVQAVDNVEGNR